MASRLIAVTCLHLSSTRVRALKTTLIMVASMQPAQVAVTIIQPQCRSAIEGLRLKQLQLLNDRMRAHITGCTNRLWEDVGNIDLVPVLGMREDITTQLLIQGESVFNFTLSQKER